MVQIKKKKLPPKTAAHINAELTRIFSKNARGVFTELLTESERVLLAKRLAILFMLENGISYYKISRTLIVSTSTIKRLHEQLLNDNFHLIHKTTRFRQDGEKFLTVLEDLLSAGLPPQGKGRWSFLYKQK